MNIDKDAMELFDELQDAVCDSESVYPSHKRVDALGHELHQLVHLRKKIKEMEHERDQAADILGVDPVQLQYYAWPQVFGSTAGPRGGIGGQVMTAYTVTAFSDGRDAVLFCGGQVWGVAKDFEPEYGVQNWYDESRLLTLTEYQKRKG